LAVNALDGDDSGSLVVARVAVFVLRADGCSHGQLAGGLAGLQHKRQVVAVTSGKRVTLTAQQQLGLLTLPAWGQKLRHSGVAGQHQI
jgi:hypothetical protein